MKKDQVVIPVVEETAHVTKRRVDRGAVRVSKIVREHEETIDTSTVHEELELDRVARNVWLDKPATTRIDGDTIIIPVMEEVTVVEKRLLLVEEVHIRRKKTTKKKKEKVRLRREEVRVEDRRKR